MTNTILNAAGAALLGVALTASANIAGLVARDGLNPTSRDPSNPTALGLCFLVPVICGIAAVLFSVPR